MAESLLAQHGRSRGRYRGTELNKTDTVEKAAIRINLETRSLVWRMFGIFQEYRAASYPVQGSQDLDRQNSKVAANKTNLEKDAVMILSITIIQKKWN